jgi:hypothetical protein
MPAVGSSAGGVINYPMDNEPSFLPISLIAYCNFRISSVVNLHLFPFTMLPLIRWCSQLLDLPKYFLAI